MYALTHALGHDLARAHQADHLTAAGARHAGRRAATARRAADREVRPGRSWLPVRSLRLIGRPAV
jgi:hypothetical protein